MNFSMTGQEKGDLLIQVIAWFDCTTQERPGTLRIRPHFHCRRCGLIKKGTAVLYYIKIYFWF